MSMANNLRKLLKDMKAVGFVIKSQNGSHLKLYNPKTNVSIPVPVHPSRELNYNLERAIRKQAGLDITSCS